MPTNPRKASLFWLHCPCLSPHTFHLLKLIHQELQYSGYAHTGLSIRKLFLHGLIEARVDEFKVINGKRNFLMIDFTYVTMFTKIPTKSQVFAMCLWIIAPQSLAYLNFGGSSFKPWWSISSFAAQCSDLLKQRIWLHLTLFFLM